MRFFEKETLTTSCIFGSSTLNWARFFTMQPRFSPAMTDNKRRRGNRGGKRKRQRQAAGPFGQNQAPGTVTPFLQGNGKNIEKQFLPFVLVLA